MRNKSVGVGVANTSSIVRDVTKFIIVVMMMSKDIHKWSDGRYVLMFDEHTFFVFDNVKEERMTALNVTKKLNELSEENASLKQRIRDIKYNNCGEKV